MAKPAIILADRRRCRRHRPRQLECNYLLTKRKRAAWERQNVVYNLSQRHLHVRQSLLSLSFVRCSVQPPSVCRCQYVNDAGEKELAEDACLMMMQR